MIDRALVGVNTKKNKTMSRSVVLQLLTGLDRTYGKAITFFTFDVKLEGRRFMASINPPSFTDHKRQYDLRSYPERHCYSVLFFLGIPWTTCTLKIRIPHRGLTVQYSSK